MALVMHRETGVNAWARFFRVFGVFRGQKSGFFLTTKSTENTKGES